MTFNKTAIDRVAKVIQPKRGVETIGEIASRILKVYAFGFIPNGCTEHDCALCLALAMSGTKCHVTKKDDSREVRITLR